jgi:hypothetical protein
MAKANELLIKYNIDMSSVRDAKDKSPIQELQARYSEKWELSLLCIIARNNLCRPIINDYANEVHIIGKPENIDVTVFMFEFYRNSILELSVKAFFAMVAKVKELTGMDMGKKRDGFIQSYYVGAVDGVKEKFAEVAKNNEAGLMCIDKTAIVQYVADKYPYLGKMNTNVKSRTLSGYHQGLNDGRSIGVRKVLN